MKTVKFIGWNVGMKKISFYKMLKNESHLTLKESKSISDAILRNEIITITFRNTETALKILEKSKEFGVKCELIGNVLE